MQSGLAVFPRRKKQVLLMIGCLGLAISCAVVLLTSKGVLGVANVIPWAVFLICGFAGLQLLGRVLRPRPVLVIDEQGLMDRSSIAGVGLIPWADIASVRVVDYQTQKILAIEMKDPQKYLDRANPLRRQAMRLNRSLAGTPFIVPLATVMASDVTLMAEIDKYLPR